MIFLPPAALDCQSTCSSGLSNEKHCGGCASRERVDTRSGEENQRWRSSRAGRRRPRRRRRGRRRRELPAKAKAPSGERGAEGTRRAVSALFGAAVAVGCQIAGLAAGGRVGGKLIPGAAAGPAQIMRMDGQARAGGSRIAACAPPPRGVRALAARSGCDQAGRCSRAGALRSKNVENNSAGEKATNARRPLAAGGSAPGVSVGTLTIIS
jgi:hypothetical protein